MYKLDLPIDQKEAASIERRKYNEEQRKSRIFNARIRQIGIDCSSLETQIKEKNEKKTQEEMLDKLYAQTAARDAKIAELMDRRQAQDVKELNKALNEFRYIHQQTDQRREFDLYDSEILKKEKPSRVCDNDPRCTVSGLQKFDGEDLNWKARQEHQLEQKKSWLDSQIQIKRQAIENENKAKRLYDLKLIENDVRLQELTDAKEECEKAITLAIKNYNLALMNEKKEKERLTKLQEEDDNRTHIINSLQSDILSENPNQSISSFGSNRIIPDRFKGMSPEQLLKIKEIQRQQIEENKKLKAEEKRINDLFDQNMAQQARQAMLLEREIERLKKAKINELAMDNLKMSKEQKEFVDYLNKEVYTNQPTADYFMQFNTCTR